MWKFTFKFNKNFRRKQTFFLLASLFLIKIDKFNHNIKKNLFPQKTLTTTEINDFQWCQSNKTIISNFKK